MLSRQLAQAGEWAVQRVAWNGSLVRPSSEQALRRTPCLDGGRRGRRGCGQDLLLHAAPGLQLLPVPPRGQRVAVVLLRVLARCTHHHTEDVMVLGRSRVKGAF